MNAALLLYAAGKGATLPACLPMARVALESGTAGRKLDELVQAPLAVGKRG
jgi:anthranilate phosphoribosyltransferase